MELKYFQVFVDGASREERVIGLKSCHAVIDATIQYIDGMTREGVAVKCISSGRAGELGRS